jgi:hypothetical protein
MDLQTLLALAIVAVTAGLFVFRRFRRNRPQSVCSGSCDCAAGLQVHGQSDILNGRVQNTDRTG